MTAHSVRARSSEAFWDAGVYVAPLDGPGARPLDTQPYAYGQTGAWSLSWSPDGKLVASVIGREWVRENRTSDSDQVTHESGGAAIDSVTLAARGTRAIYTVR